MEAALAADEVVKSGGTNKMVGELLKLDLDVRLFHTPVLAPVRDLGLTNCRSAGQPAYRLVPRPPPRNSRLPGRQELVDHRIAGRRSRIALR